MSYLKTISLLIFFLCISVHRCPAQEEFDFLLKNSKNYEHVVVKEIHSADTFTIRNQENQKETIKMIGIKALKAPRSKRIEAERDEYGFIIKPDVDPESPIEEQSFNFVKGLLQDKTVRLEFDSSKKDEDNNTLAYVFLVDDNTFINAEILRQGMSELQIRPPNTKYKEQLRQAYRDARTEKRGLQSQ
ncbi:MAG: thermonuclease family protein [Candidatus Omnitrophica bacterium]|nr:thermonuclease family protein [Candidatus Omnitrophota bacterium]